MSHLIIPDTRFHEFKGKRYPRVTAVCGQWPKDEGFYRWLGDMNSYDESIKVRDDAGTRGTFVHGVAGRLINGEEIAFEEVGQVDTWQKVEAFANFWADHKPEPIAQELFMASDILGTAGTCDLVAMVGGKLTIIDWKTSTSLHHEYDMQVAVYGELYKETTGGAVDELWLVRLGSRHKRGYELKTMDAEERALALEHFKLCQRIWDYKVGALPADHTVRKSIKL